MVATKIVPIVIGSKVTVGPLASGDPQVILSHMECLPQALALSHGWTSCRPLHLALLGLLFMAPTGKHITPHNDFFGATHKLLACFDRDHTTKLCRRRQPARVTSTIGLQLDHLVPLNTITQCNTLEIPHLQWICTSRKHKLVRGFSNKELGIELFIALKPNRAVGALE
jgi:hypothetical protein